MRILRYCLPLLAFAAAAPRARALTLDEILQKNLAARGGAEKIAALKSVRFTGKMKFSGWGGEFELNKLVARPGRLRDEQTMQGLTQITAWDGSEGWTISPFGGRKDPEKMSADEAKELAESADLDGPLIGWKEAGSKIEYLGTEDVDGTEALKLKVTLKNGDLKFVYLDPDYFLEIRITSRQTVRGVEYDSEVDLGDYAQVEGVWFPMAIEAGQKGGPKGAKTGYTKAEANVAVDEKQFQFPESKPEVKPSDKAAAPAGGKS
jgi:hypothetical protein